MSETISGYHNTLQRLNTATPTVFVTGTINAYGSAGTYMVNGGGGTLGSETIDAALFGPAAGHFSIHNNGLIETHGTNPSNQLDVGIVLGASGSIYNTDTIQGGSGVAILGTTGTAYLYNGGLIGGSIGVGGYFQGDASVVNTGSINGADTGLQLASGGRVTNTSTGTITGDTGIYLSSAGTLINSGGVQGAQTGIGLGTSGYANNSGTITAGNTGVFLGSSATLVNSGTIKSGTSVVSASGNDYIKNSGLIASGTSSSGLLKGILLENGSRLNNAGGSISGAFYGVYADTNTSILNSGSITGGTFGVLLKSNSTLNNQGAVYGNDSGGNFLAGSTINNSGTIGGAGTGLYFRGSLTNSGLIQGHTSTGVGVGSGDSLNNLGTILGVKYGISDISGVSSQHVYISNSGTIRATGFGISLAETATITNLGEIIGGGTNGAIDIAAGRVIYGPGAYFGGKVTVRDGTGVLELANGGTNPLDNAGQTNGNFNSQFTGFNSIVIDSGAYWDISGATTFASTVAVTNNGTIAQIIIDDLNIDGALGGTGVVLVDSVGLSLNGSVSSGQQVSFAYDSGVLSLGDSTEFSGTITNFHAADTIQLNGFTATSHSYISGSGLVLSNGTTTETLDIAGSFATESFTVSQDAGGTEITICYLRGTKILTPAGEVNVETLKIGDNLITRFGGVRPIKWIGRQSFARRFVKNNRAQFPVRIEAGALGNNLPKRDLSVSPGHSMLLNGQLVLAKSLVNGVNITQHHAPADIHYYQIEFETHDCVQAEGAWSESYADSEGMRNKFHNAATFFALYPDYKSPAEPQLCAPRPLEGPELSDLLQPVIARAAAETAAGPLRGWVDAITADGLITGWAQDEANPELPVLLELVIEDKVIRRFLACDYRGDLAQAGIGQGRCSFAITAPATISPETLNQMKIRRVADATPLPFSHELQAGLKTAA